MAGWEISWGPETTQKQDSEEGRIWDKSKDPRPEEDNIWSGICRNKQEQEKKAATRYREYLSF